MKRTGLTLLKLALAAIAIPLAWLLVWGLFQSQKLSEYDRYIQEAAKRYSIDPHLIRAVIWQESGFDPRAVGAAKERGLMQVTPIAAGEWAKAEAIADFTPERLFDPRTNILAGSWYLARASRRWKKADTPYVFALAEYNAGRSQALRWSRSLPEASRLSSSPFQQAIDYPTTKEYVASVMKRYHHYQQQAPSTPLSAAWDKLSRMWYAWSKQP